MFFGYLKQRLHSKNQRCVSTASVSFLRSGTPSTIACTTGEISFEEFAKMLGPSPGRHEDGSKFDCKGRHGLKTYKWESARGCDWCKGVIPPQTRILVCVTCDVDVCHSCTAEYMESTAKRITCKARHGLVKRTFTGVDKCSACKGHIPEGATLFSCRLVSSVSRKVYRNDGTELCFPRALSPPVGYRLRANQLLPTFPQKEGHLKGPVMCLPRS